MKKRIIIAALFTVFFSTISNAQFGGLIKKGKTEKFKPVDFKSSSSTPSIDFVDFLSVFDIETFPNFDNSEFPSINLNNSGIVHGFFIPSKYADGSSVNYSSLNANRPEDAISEMHWLIEKDNIAIGENPIVIDDASQNRCTMRFYQSNPIYIKESGDYVLKIKIQSTVIFEFNFKVVKLINDDKFAEKNYKTLYYLDGAWDKMPHLSFDDDGGLSFYFLSRYADLETKSGNKLNSESTLIESRELYYGVELYYNSKLFSEKAPLGSPKQIKTIGSKNKTIGRFMWSEMRHPMYKPGNTESIKKPDLMDGEYLVKLYTGIAKDSDKPNCVYGYFEYKFSVKNKKIITIPEQDIELIKDQAKYIESFDKYYILK